MVSLDTEKYKDKTYRLQPVADIYLESAGLSGNLYSRAGNANELKYYMAIAFAILLIAITNYVFLTKAKILNRLTEMGARKALGASNATIQKQVLLESNLVSFLSLLPAVIVVIVGIPFVNSTLGKTVGSEVFSLWQTWAVLAVLLFLTGNYFRNINWQFCVANISGGFTKGKTKSQSRKIQLEPLVSKFSFCYLHHSHCKCLHLQKANQLRIDQF